MQGSVLYPLNSLRAMYPDVYTHHMQKYANRMHVPRQHIPLFDNCLWNDVLFTSAVEPAKLYEARRQAGWPEMPPPQFYKIDPRKLDQTKLGVFLFRPNRGAVLGVDDFTQYNYEDLATYSQIPRETIEYYAQEFAAGESNIKLFWRFIPHILYHGAIDVSDVKIISVQ